MEEFQESFKQLIQERKDTKLNLFFKDCLDMYEEQELEFIKWFSQAFPNKHVNCVDVDYMLVLFEQQFQLWYHELRIRNL